MKLNAKAWGDYDHPAFASGTLNTPNNETKKVTLIADGTVDHAVWGELTGANPGLADQFIPSLHDPRFSDHGRGGVVAELGDNWTTVDDESGSYQRLGTDAAHQRYYSDSKLVTVTPSFTHTVEGRRNFDGLDPTSPEEQLELNAPQGSVFFPDDNLG